MYRLTPTEFIKSQLKELDHKTRQQLKDPLRLTKNNPFRNKALHYPGIRLFRIRFSDKRKEKRLIYTIEGNEVILLFILNRDDDYKDLEKMLKKIEKDY